MGKIKQADLLESALLELQETAATVKTFAALMGNTSKKLDAISFFEIARIFWMIARKLNDVTDTIEGVHYEIDKEGL